MALSPNASSAPIRTPYNRADIPLVVLAENTSETLRVTKQFTGENL